MRTRHILSAALAAMTLGAAPAAEAQTTDHIYINLNDGRYIRVELNNFADVSLTPNGGEVAEIVSRAAVEWVDLGLPSGTLWASCNLGAAKPWDSGDYYAWGETELKEEYTESNCATYGKNLATLRSEGYIDDNNNLTAAHDVATVKLGSGAHLPTMIQMNELVTKCTSAWFEDYNGTGVSGWLVTGPNGNSIFFPTTGRLHGAELIGAGTHGYCWGGITLRRYHLRKVYRLLLLFVRLDIPLPQLRLPSPPGHRAQRDFG